MVISTFLLALAAAAVSVVAAGQAPESDLPVFFFHGVTGNATNGLNIKANLTAEGRVFVGLTFCENECSVQSVTAQIPMAIEQIRSIVKNDSRFDNGYHLVGHSQGGGIARAVVENMDDHKVHSLVNMNREPADAYFLENNTYLPYLNNLNTCAADDFACNWDKIRRKVNFLRLKSAHLPERRRGGPVATLAAATLHARGLHRGD